MKLGLFGYGRMGHAVEEVALSRGHEIVFRADGPEAGSSGDLVGELRDCEVAIDFSVPGAVVSNVRRAAETGVALVVGTTGWYGELDEVRSIVEAAGTGLVYASNFSLGVHLFLRLAREAGRLVNQVPDLDVTVAEIHHRHKLDHPSGTAGTLAEILVEGLQAKERWAAALPEGTPPDPSTLYVASVRSGENPGTHIVEIDGPYDRIELRHEARGRAGFAQGAVEAAEWVRGRTGIFTIDEVLDERFG